MPRLLFNIATALSATLFLFVCVVIVYTIVASEFYSANRGGYTEET